MRTVESIQDIQDMARGAVLLGTGGGGDPYIGELFLLAQLKRGRMAHVVDASDPERNQRIQLETGAPPADKIAGADDEAADAFQYLHEVRGGGGQRAGGLQLAGTLLGGA